MWVCNLFVLPPSILLPPSSYIADNKAEKDVGIKEMMENYMIEKVEMIKGQENTDDAGSKNVEHSSL